MKGKEEAERGLAGLVDGAGREGEPSEQELRPGRGAVADGYDDVVDAQKKAAPDRDGEDEQGKEQLEGDPPKNNPEVDDLAVLGAEPGDPGQDEDAQEADEIVDGHG